MNEWDTIFGEAALGLDLAKPEFFRAAVDTVSAPRSQRSAAELQGDPHRDRLAAPTATTSAGSQAEHGARPPERPRTSPKLVSRPPVPATNPEAIFRREALEFRVRGRDTPGGVVRLGARWIHWAYRLTLVLIVFAVAGMWLIRTDESTSGTAVIDGRNGTIALLLPAVAGPDLASSRTLTVILSGGHPVRISGLRAQLASGSIARKAGIAPLAQPAILITGQLDLGTTPPVVGGARLQTQASVVLRSEPLADVLGRQFRAMLGNGTTP